jgi:hypothetical protein
MAEKINSFIELVSFLIRTKFPQDTKIRFLAILESGGATTDAYNGTDYYQPQYDGIVKELK